MSKGGYRLPFDLFGVPIRLDATFLLLIVLLTWLIGGNVASYVKLFGLSVDPSTLARGGTPWLLGLASALGLMVSVLIHELAHALTARRYGVEIVEIRLWILGGIAQFRQMPRQPRAEAVVAIAGPLASAALGLLLWWSSGLLGRDAGALLVVVSYLAAVNLTLAIFNLLPAMPMDGGRVLRSLLALSMGHLRATRVAAAVSRLLAVAMGLFGLATLNLFLVAIAFFVWIAVQAETQAVTVEQALGDTLVRELMSPEPATVPPGITVEAFLRRMFSDKHVFYPVIDEAGKLIGSVRLQDVAEVDRDATVAEVMSREVATIGPDAAAIEAFRRIEESQARRLVVIGPAGELLGIVSTTDLLRAVQIRLVDRSKARD